MGIWAMASRTSWGLMGLKFSLRFLSDEHDQPVVPDLKEQTAVPASK